MTTNRDGYQGRLGLAFESTLGIVRSVELEKLPTKKKKLSFLRDIANECPLGAKGYIFCAKMSSSVAKSYLQGAI